MGLALLVEMRFCYTLDSFCAPMQWDNFQYNRNLHLSNVDHIDEIYHLNNTVLL
jgi:hypothetical protein